jgi:hypothetical protein
MLKPVPARPTVSSSPAGIRPAQLHARASVVAFQYTGTTTLTAIGPLSGRRYHFGAPNAVVEVDPRDRASLATVPNLRQV